MAAITNKLVGSPAVAGLTNQAVVSAGNFGLNLILARALSATDFGAFTLLFSIFLFFNNIHQSLVTYPLSIRGATAQRMEFRAILGAALTATMLSQSVFFPVVAVACALIGGWSLIGASGLALFLWQLYEVNRRALLARGLYWSATLGDIIRYAGVCAAVLVLAGAHRLMLLNVFLVISAGSWLAAVASILVAPSWLSPRWSALASELNALWRVGFPYMGATLLGAFSGQWFLWLLAWNSTLADAAAFQALTNIASVVFPIMFGIENIIVPEIARRRHSLGRGALFNLLYRRSRFGFAILVPLFIAGLAAPDSILRLLYGQNSVYAQYGSDLRILLLAYAALFVATILAAALRAYLFLAPLLRMQLYTAVFSVIIGSWLTLSLGVGGACWAWLLANTLRVLIAGHYVRKLP